MHGAPRALDAAKGIKYRTINTFTLFLKLCRVVLLRTKSVTKKQINKCMAEI